MRMGKLTVGFLVVLLVGGCQAATSRQTIGPTKVRLAHPGREKLVIYLPVYVAMEKDFFTDEGLDVDLLYSGNDGQVLRALIAGEAEFGIGDPALTAMAREKGAAGKVVATLLGRISNWGVGRNKAIPVIRTPKGLDGLRISSFPAPSRTSAILADIRKQFALPKMVIVPMAPGTEMGALRRDEVDIALTGEPAVSAAESKGYPVVLSLADYCAPFVFSGMTTTDAMIDRKPETVQGMVSAIQTALEFLRAEPEETAQIAARTFPELNPAVLKQAIHRLIHEKNIPEDARVTNEAWRKTLEIRRQLGGLKSMDVRSSVDSSFAEKAFNPSTRRQLREQRQKRTSS